MNLWILSPCLALLLVSALAAQEPRGLPPIEHFVPNVPGGGDAYEAVLHASDGLLYALTQEELLTFDGARWSRYGLPGARTWTSLADRSEGGVFVGGDEEIGVLIPDAAQGLRFQSLLARFPEKRRTLNVVTTLFCQDGVLYFTDEAQSGRIRLDETHTRGLELDLLGVASHRGFKDGAHYLVAPSKTGAPYVVVKGKGICRWTSAGLRLIPGGEEYRTMPLLILQEEGPRLLVVGHGRSLEWLEEGRRTPLSIEGRDKLPPHIATGFCKIPGIGYALATNKGGLLIFDAEGDLVWHLDQDRGLGTNSLYVSPAPDRQGGLWVPLESGLLRIGLQSSIRIFDEDMGLAGEVRDSCWHQGKWYVATSQGIYRYEDPEGPGLPGSFRRIDEWTLQIGTMKSDGDNLLLSTEFGLLRVRIDEKGDLHPLRFNSLQGCVFLLARDKKRLWSGGHHGGLEEFTRENGKWKKGRRILTTEWTPHAFAESADGPVYVLAHIHHAEDRLQVMEITGSKPARIWGTGRDASPALSELRLYSWKGKVFLRSPEQTFELVGSRSVRVGRPDEAVWGRAAQDNIVQPLAESSDRIWYLSKDHRFLCLRQQDDLSWAQWNPFRELAGGHAQWFEVSPDGREAWMGNRKVLAHYKEPESLLSRQTVAPKIWDLLSLDGNFRSRMQASGSHRPETIPRDQAAFRIRYSLPAFDGTWHRVYQTRLSGFDETWTPWRRTPFREFTGLPAGSYRFEVRSLDPQGRLTSSAGLDIRIPTPWYETLWAWLAYVVLGGILVWGLVKARTWVAEKRIRRLEEEIRQRELAEREKARLEEQLRQSQRLESLGRMAGGVAHDFNNILTAILGHAELVREDAAPGRVMDEQTFASVREIMRSGHRAADLTHRLLAFSRKQVLHPRVVDVNEILQGLELMLTRLIREDIEMRMHLDPEAGKVRVDPGQIEQVILNLVLNACDAMPEGGVLEVGTRVDPKRKEDASFGTVTISVRDNGTGIDEDILERIFEPFFTTKPPGEGTGLGLSSALGIVEQSGGTLEVSSQPGEGTWFEITFPRLEASVVLPAPPPEEQPAGSGERILLVDDDESVRSVARILLSSKGYSIQEAASGDEALRLFGAEEHWDLLLTDMVMPGMSGRELARQLRGRQPDLPVLFFSGYSAELETEPAGVEESSAFLQKPFHAKSLLAAVRALLDYVPSRTHGAAARDPGDFTTEAPRTQRSTE